MAKDTDSKKALTQKDDSSDVKLGVITPSESNSEQFKKAQGTPKGDATSSSEASEVVKSGAKHAKEKPPVPAYVRKSRKMRKILIVVIVLLVLLLGAGAYLGYHLLETAKNAATQQTQDIQISDATSISGEGAAMDASTSTAKITTVPDLVSLLGLSDAQAVEVLQHGAQVTSSIDVNEEGNPIKREIRIALTTEPSDTRSGTPTVYLSLNEQGVAIQAGYSVATSALGYGSLSFSDAIQNEHIIEKTLDEAGLSVAEGSVVLPADKMVYSTYASDGTTLTRENCSFEGVGSALSTGAELPWTAILSYDYSTANATGNLVDTIRTVYVYISATPADIEAAAQAPTQ